MLLALVLVKVVIVLVPRVDEALQEVRTAVTAGRPIGTTAVYQQIRTVMEFHQLKPWVVVEGNAMVMIMDMVGV